MFLINNVIVNQICTKKVSKTIFTLLWTLSR